MSYSAEVLADSPVAYWRLGEASGTAAADASGNGHVATYTAGFTLGAAGLVSGDTAVSFDGTANARVVAPAGSYANFGTGDFSVEFWFRTADAGLKLFLGNEAGSAWWIGVDGGKLHFNSATSGNLFGSATVSDNAPHHAVLTRASGVARFYLDGGTDGGTATLAGVVGDSGATGLGNFSGGGYGWSGTLDEVALYHSALSPSRIAAHHAAAAGGAGATLTVAPTSVPAGTSGNALTLTGSGTSWTAGTPGSPTLTASAGTITAQSVASATSATLTYTAPGSAGSVTLTDPSTGATATLTVAAAPVTIPTNDVNWFSSPYNWK